MTISNTSTLSLSLNESETCSPLRSEVKNKNSQMLHKVWSYEILYFQYLAPSNSIFKINILLM